MGSFTEFDDNSQPQANLSLRLGAEANPDQAAKDLKTSRRFNVPPAVAEMFREDFDAKAKTEDGKRIVNESPKLQGWLAFDDQRAKVAHDDVENLGALEFAWSKVKNAGRAVASTAPTMSSGLYGVAAAPFEVAGQGLRVIEDAIAELMGAPKGMGKNVGELVGGFLLNESRAQERVSKDIGPDKAGMGVFERGVYSGLTSAVQTLSVLPAGPAGLGILAGTAGGQSYTKGREKLTPSGAAVYGVEDAAAEFITEKFAYLKFLGDIKAGTTLGKMVVNNLAREIPGELAATTWQSFNEWQNLNPDKSVKEWIDTLPEQLAETLVATVVGGGVQAGAAKGFSRVMGGKRQAEQGGQAADALKAMTDMAAASKVLERDTETFETFAQSLLEDGQEYLYVDPKVLEQSGMAGPLAAASPEIAAQIQDAMVSGADVRIPTQEFLGRMVKDGSAQKLLADVKTDPNGFTQNEAKEHLKEHGKALESEVERVLSQQEGDDAWKVSRGTVQADIEAKMNAAGRHTPDVNKANATLMANVFTTLAHRLKQAGQDYTPEKLYREFEPRIVSQTTGKDVLDQESPAFKNWFGESKVVDAAGKPLVVYHATDADDITQFDRAKLGTTTSFNTDDKEAINMARLGFWFARHDISVDGNPTASGVTYPVMLSIKTPRVYSTFASMWAQAAKYENADSWREALEKKGFDGVVLRSDTEFNTRSFVAFRPEQIKSAIGNRGTYDPNDPNILNQALNGSGESAASLESMSRIRDEMAKGQFRAKIGKDGTITPLIGPNAVDQRARPGEVIVQKGVGKDRWTVLESAPVPGLLYLDQGSRDDGKGTHNVVVWDQGVIDELNKQIDKSFAQPARGTFDPSTNTIALLKNANLSTFLHESGHFYLEVLSELASRPKAPQAIREDMDKLLKWFGVDSLESWNLMPLDEKRASHEKFARGFESYLFEGVSPNPEMQGLFQRFRSWLVSVYKSISKLNVNLTDEVRGVMDRLIATDEQIAQAEAARNMGLMFKDEAEAKKFGVDWTAYQAQGADATQAAVESLQTKGLQDMKWLSNAKSRKLKELQDSVASIRADYARQAREDIMQYPVYQVWDFLTKKGDRVNAGEVVATEDADVFATGKLRTSVVQEMNPEAVSLLKERRMLEEKNGIHPDVLAEQFKFSSGDEMIKALIEAMPPAQKVEELVDSRMLQEHGELSTPEGLENAVNEAIHNQVRSRFVATELAALEKALKGKTLPSAAKAFARNLVARTRIRDLRPAQFDAAASRAGRASLKAFKKGDIQEAASQKRGQLINGYAAKAAVDAKAEVDQQLDYLKKFSKPSKTLDPDYADQIATLLERFDLGRGTSLKAIDKRASLATWIAEQEEMGIEVDLPPEVTAEAYRKSYKEMSVEEFRGIVDTVRQVEHLGRLKHKLLTAKNKREFDAARDEIVASVVENGGDKHKDNRTRDTMGGRAVRLFTGFVASHRKTASLAREMDGFKAGPMWEYLIRSMNDAGNKEAGMRESATMHLTKLLKPVLKQGRINGKGTYFESLGMSMNRGERLVMALNTGNAGNLQRMLDGKGWSIEQIRPALDTLTKDDWDFVQAVWDHFETYRPEIAAKERRVAGKEPDWIEPTQVVTKHGTYRGGYYPVKYDPRESGRAENFANAEGAKHELKGAFVASTTRRSFTKTRAKEVKGRPLLLTFDGLYGGLNEVIHDLSWHEWTIDANRLLRNDQIDKAIRDNYGADHVAQLKQAVQDIAAGDGPRLDALSRVLAPLRTGAVVAGLGFNLMNAVIQPLGLTQSMVRVGTRWIAQGVAEWAKSPVGLVRQVHEKSEFMRLRGKTQQRELNEIRSVVQGQGPVRQKLNALMFTPMTGMQLIADMPTWWGAYQKALSEDSDETRAVDLADQAVLDSQGGGQVKDLSNIQRGSALQKLFTTFYGFFNTAYNLGVERAKETNYRSPLDVMHLAWDFLLLYSVPAVLASLLKDAIQGGDDDEEKLAKKLLGEQISYLMGLMVGLREITGAVQYATDSKQFNTAYGGPAGLRFFQELDKLGKQVGQGEVDRALARSAVNVGGVLLHLPSGQVNRTVDGVIAISEGRTKNPIAVLAGVPAEQR